MNNKITVVVVSITCYLFGFGLVPGNCLDSNCKNDITYGFKQNFTWNVSTTTGFYASEPFCYDIDGNLIERHCKESMWFPKYVTCNENLPRSSKLRIPSNSSSTQVETILTFDAKRNEMLLIVYNSEMVKRISCYTFEIDKTNVSYNLLFDSKNISLQFSLKRYLVYELEIEVHPKEYWCEISQRNASVVTTPKVIGHKERRIYQEFVMRLSWDSRYSSHKLMGHCHKIDVKCREMNILSYGNQKSDVLIHVTLYFKNNNIMNGYNKLYHYFRKVFDLKYVLNSDYCLLSTTVTNELLVWKLTPLGEKAKPSKMCLNDKGYLITRKCIGNFLHGAHFEEFNKVCSEDVIVPDNTGLLYEILSQHNFTAEVFKNFSSLLKGGLNISINDVSVFADGLFETSEIDEFYQIEEDYLDSVNTLNSLDPEILSSSQITLNATDIILNSVEKFLVKKAEMDLNETRPTILIQRSNFIIFATKPSLSNISGIALIRNDSKSFLNYSLKELSNQDVLQSIPRDNLELGLHVPQSILDLNGNSSLIITIYSNCSLFNEENETNTANSRVIGVIMPGLGKYLEAPIPLLLRPLETMNGTFSGCGYWQYGEASPNKKGKWSTKGGEDVDVDDMIYCTFSHLTHFGLLILSGRKTYEKEGVAIIIDSFLPYSAALNTITITGCSLSLIGITGIFLTASVFRRFREKIGTKILMLLSIPISLEIIFTQLAGLDNWHNNPTVCTVIGVLLHYVVLLKFSWMAVIAVLQYIRFVKVLGPMPQNIFLKANLICWLAPILPVSLSVIFTPEGYSPGIQNFCYPKDLTLYLGLFTPASLIIIFNVSVFAMIMISISNSKAVKYDKSGSMLRRQTYQAILLFFMLGIPWVFGILAEILQFGWLEITFVYLFCLTATLQGFVLFAFYVVFDKDTRSLWINYIKHGRT